MAKGGGVFKIYEEPELPNEGCVRYIMNRRRQMRRHVAVF